jgi:Kef-type K+ transport system membrane component KefB
VQIQVKFLLSATVFAIGAILSVIPYFTMDHFEFLIPGIILIAISTPFTYYFYAKMKNKHAEQNDADILRQAEIESRISKENDNDEK